MTTSQSTASADITTLPDTACGDRTWVITWTIDAEGSTPEAAAASVWTEIFGRTAAGADDACVFTVTDSTTGQSTNVDLSDHDFPSLLA